MSVENLPVLLNEIELSCSKMSINTLITEHINGFFTNIARFINYESLIKPSNIGDKYIIVDCPIIDYTIYINSIISQYILGLTIYSEPNNITADAMALLVNDIVIFNYYSNPNVRYDKEQILSQLDTILRGENVSKVELYISSSDGINILSNAKYVFSSINSSIPFWDQSQYKFSAFN